MIENAARGRLGPLAREVGADDIPTVPAVSRLEQDVAREIEDVRVDRRKQHGGRAEEPILARARTLRGDVLHLARPAIEFRDLAAVDEVGIERVDGDVAV